MRQHAPKSQSSVSLRDNMSSLEEVLRSCRARRMSLEAIKRARLEAQAQIRALNTKPNIGRKISAVGLALIICPDPFSDIVGVPLFIFGELVKRVYSPLTFTDLMKEAKSTLEALKEAGRISSSNALYHYRLGKDSQQD